MSPQIDSPMGALIGLLSPVEVSSKIVAGGGRWRIRKPRYGGPAFCLMLEGSCVLEPDGLAPIELGCGDFLLLPEVPAFTLGDGGEGQPVFRALDSARYVRHGGEADAVTMRMLGGYFRFDPANAALLVSLLPSAVQVRRDDRGSARLTRLVELIADEANDEGVCRDAILQRLVEVLMIEAIRLRSDTALDRGQRGLIAGLGDPVVAGALHALHADIARAWTVEQLAREASVSRAVFAERFTRVLGIPPMQYLTEWRIASAKNLLRIEQLSAGQVAVRVGYNSASAFAAAFARVAGCSPGEFAR